MAALGVLDIEEFAVLASVLAAPLAEHANQSKYRTFNNKQSKAIITKQITNKAKQSKQ